MIPFNIPPYVGKELEYIREAMEKIIKFVEMDLLQKNVMNGWKKDLMLKKFF